MNDIALHVDQQRAEGLLGASDAACALGLDRYKSPLTLWRQLRGLETDDSKPAYVQEAAEWGQALEPVVRGKYALKTRRAVYVPRESTVLDGWLRCTPDGFVSVDERDFTESPMTLEVAQRPSVAVAGLLQCKTASAYKRDEWEIGVPIEHEIQERVEMAVCDLPWADVCCLVGGQKFVGPIRVARDAKLEDRLLTDLAAFWRLVKTGVEPSVDGTAAWREHASERLGQLKAKLVVVPDDEARKDIAAWLAARQSRDIAARCEAEIKNRLLLRLSAVGATGFELGEGRKLSAYQVGAKPSWKDYALSLGGAAKVPEQFRGTSNTWTLRAPNEEPNGD